MKNHSLLSGLMCKVPKLTAAIFSACSALLCVGCGPDIETIPAAKGGIQRYAGTSPSDIWQLPKDGSANDVFITQHWNGEVWSTVSIPGDFGWSTYGPVAGDGALWVWASKGALPVVWTLHRVHADGSDELVALPPALDPPFDKKAKYRVEAYRGAVFAVVGGFGPDPQGHEISATPRIYRRDGESWTPLPNLPSYLFEAFVRVGVDGEILVDGRVGGPNANYAICDPASGLTSPFFRLQGDTWVPVPADPCIEFSTEEFFSIANPIFPIDDVWSRDWQYDGSKVSTPDTTAPPRRFYTRIEGKTVRISEQFAGAADDPGESWNCDAVGNCVPGDSFTYTGTEWIAHVWNGSKWEEPRVVANGETCVGAGCIYRGDTPGVVGLLEDGTVLIHQPSTEDEGPTLAIVRP